MGPAGVGPTRVRAPQRSVTALARVVAYVPDLLFGSRVLSELRHGGYDALLASDVDFQTLSAADALVVDLTADFENRIERVSEARSQGLRILAFYSHVEPAVRERAEEARFDLIVPRSRVAREGTATLLDRLLADED